MKRLSLVALFLAVPIASAPRRVAAEPVRFQEDVRPLLAANCVACHNARQKEGGLSLETLASIVEGGDSGPAVAAGKPDESLLVVRAAHRDASTEAMPPEGNRVGARPLTKEEIERLERWIAEGAVADGAESGSPIAWRHLPPGTGPVVAIDVTPDGRLVAAAQGSRVSLFDAATGGSLASLVDAAASADGLADSQAHRDPVAAIAFSPMGDRLATGSFRTIKLWQRRPPAISAMGDAAAATALAVSCDGKIVAVGLPDGGVEIVEASSRTTASSRRMRRLLSIHEASIAGLCFSADGSTLYSLATSGAVAATGLADGVTTGRLSRPAGTSAVAWLDAGRLVTAEPDGVVRVWSLPLSAPAVGDAAAAEPRGSPDRELGGKGPPVIAVAAVPGRPGLLVAAGGDGIARLWNVDAASVVREFAHGGPIVAMAVRSDGSRLATAGTVPGVKLWNLADGAIVAEAKGDVRLARRLAAADLAVAVAGQDADYGRTRVASAEQEIAAAMQERTKAAETEAAAAKMIDEKTREIASAEQAKRDADLAASMARAAEPVAKEAHAAAVKAQASASAAADAAAASRAAFAKSGSDPVALAAVQAAKTAADAATVARAAADRVVAEAAAASERAKTRSRDADKKAADAATALAQRQEDRKRADTALAAAKRGIELAIVRERNAHEELPRRRAELDPLDKAVVAATWARTAIEKAVAESARPAVAVAFSQDGRWLAGLGDDGRLSIVGAADGRIRDVFDAARPLGAAKAAGLLAFVECGVVVAGAGVPAAAWDVRESWQLSRSIGGESTPPSADDDAGGPPVGTVTALAFSPDGSLLASGSGRTSRSGEIKIWDVESGMLSRSLPLPHTDTVMAVAFSHRGDMLASAAADRVVKVHSVADGAVVRAFEGHMGHALGVAWQPHGRVLASAGGDGAVKVWDIASGGQKRTINGPKKEVTGVRFAGATDELVVSAGDPIVRIYNVADGAVMRDFVRGGESPAGGDFVNAIAVAPAVVVAGYQSGLVQVWNRADASPLQTIEPVAGPPQPGTSSGRGSRSTR